MLRSAMELSNQAVERMRYPPSSHDDWTD